MDVRKGTVESLFGLGVQYRIPLFQRHYVWDEENQWQFLWDDIEKSQNRENQEGSSAHFTGAIVIQQKPTPAGGVPKYEIIDGQQRLTTFQIIFCAIRDICKEHGHDDIADNINCYVLNQGVLIGEDEQLKLIPTKFDRPSFISLVNGQIDEQNGRIHLAYHYFRGKIDKHVKGEREKMIVLFSSILKYFDFVQILIDGNDKPEKIFESLNARGKSLLQFDLLRNDLFLRASEDRDRLYNKYWDHFEGDYWDQERKDSRTLCEWFLQHFLMAKLGTEGVKPEFHVYQRRYCERLRNTDGIEHEFSELKRYSEVYREMTDCADDSEIGKRMKFYQVFGLTTLHPFILFVRCEVGLSGDALNHVFDILESYTLRRMLCCGGKRGLLKFNIFFSELIRRLRNNFSLESFIKKLADETSNTTKYPTDNEIEPTLYTHYDEHSTFLPDDSTIVFPDNRAVKAALHRLWFESAGAIKMRLIRYILYRIELMKMEENKFTEHFTFKDDLTTLEHIMPSEWKKTWRLPTADGAITYGTDISNHPYVSVNTNVEDSGCLYEKLFDDPKKPSREGLVNTSYLDAFNLALTRDQVLQSIGNLTLVTRELNAKLGNRPFLEKKTDLKASRLMLNSEIRHYQAWDVNEIHTRAEKLIADVCKIWPSLQVIRARVDSQN